MAHPSRELILRAASARFAVHGLHGTTMRSIADAVGLHLPSIYHFFGSKDALYALCTEAAFQRSADHLEAQLGPVGPGGADRPRLVVFVAALCSLLRSDDELRAFLIQRHRRGTPWLAGTALAGVFGQFAALVEGMRHERPHHAPFGDRLVGLALGHALGRDTGRAEPGGRRADEPPPVDPGALLEVVSPGWRLAAP